MIIRFNLILLLLISGVLTNAQSSVLSDISLSKDDSVLVVGADGKELFSWQASKPLVPASLTKLATAYLAIEKWGLDYRFHTDFLIEGDTLWVKGYGDPFLVSEELDRVVLSLKGALSEQDRALIRRINIDNSYFSNITTPGRSRGADPYNAPVSAVSANFNTAKLRNKKGLIESAEPQTPLTKTAKKMAYLLVKSVDRVNLLNASNAQYNAAELLIAKLDWSNIDINIDQILDDRATLLYRHKNSHTLADVLRGTLEFSNNFIANQVFLKLPESVSTNTMRFTMSREYANDALGNEFGWRNHQLHDGSGLSRQNRLSAQQIDDLLNSLQPHKGLFKKIKVNSESAIVYAKTGTLNGVRSYAGYINLPQKSFPQSNTTLASQQYRFVFNFNRTVEYRYRDKVLNQLINDLETL